MPPLPAAWQLKASLNIGQTVGEADADLAGHGRHQPGRPLVVALQDAYAVKDATARWLRSKDRRLPTTRSSSPPLVLMRTRRSV